MEKKIAQKVRPREMLPRMRGRKGQQRKMILSEGRSRSNLLRGQVDALN